MCIDTRKGRDAIATKHCLHGANNTCLEITLIMHSQMFIHLEKCSYIKKLYSSNSFNFTFLLLISSEHFIATTAIFVFLLFIYFEIEDGIIF